VRIRLLWVVFLVGAATISSADAQPAWLYASSAKEIFQIDPKSGAATTIGRLAQGPLPLADIAVTPDGAVYAVTSDSLLRLNPATGLTSVVAPLNVSGRANALASDRLGRLFGATDLGELFEVDGTTGQSRLIGSFGSAVFSEGDLAFAPDGTLFATSSGNDLLRVDPTTGRATPVGGVGFKQLEGLAFDADGRLYASSVAATFLVVDPTSGTAVPQGVFDNNQHMSGLAIVPLVNLRSATNGLELTLAWEPLGASLSYVLEAGSAPGLKDVYVGDIGNRTTLTASAPAAGTYFLRLRARTARGVGFPSNEVHVTLGSPHCVSPPAPTGFTADVRRETLTLEWNAVAGAISYQLEAGTARELANAYVGNVGSNTSVRFNVATVPRMPYYLRVRAVASCGLLSIPTEIVFDLR
jgi:streptogramin lyase